MEAGDLTLNLPEISLLRNLTIDDSSANSDSNDDITGKNAVRLLTQGKYEEVLKTASSIDIFSGLHDHNESNKYDDIIMHNVIQYLSSNSEDSLSRQLTILSIAVASLQLFVRDNWIGPPLDDTPKYISCENEKQGCGLDEFAVHTLAVDGDVVSAAARNATYLWLAKTILLDCQADLKDCWSLDWWLLRCIQINQSLIEERSPTLKATTIDIIDKLSSSNILNSPEYSDLAIMFNLEAGHLCYFYYEPKKAKAHFDQAEKLSGLNISLTGQLGKRTRFQQKDISQLVLQVEYTNGKQPYAPNALTDSDIVLPKNVSLDDDTVLENITLIDKDKELVAQISAIQQALVLGLCYRHRRSVGEDHEILQEECLAYVNSVLQEPQAWSCQTAALLMRSLWEQKSMRRLQRAMSQLEELVNQYKRDDPPASQRIHLLYCVKIPPLWEMQQELAALFEKVGAVNAALELYQRIQAWDNVIKCYIHLGKKEKANKLIREQLEMKETPLLWCYLGDIHNDPEYYHKSWELSNSRFGRAQRSLAYLYLHKKEHEKSLPCFEKSLQVNSLQLGVWFSYGCAALAAQDYNLAAHAFRRCVDLDSDNFQAWNNLTTAYIRSNQKVRAFATMQEALKCEFENWRLWENYLLIATDIGEFSAVIKAYHRLLDLKDKHLDVEVLEVLVRAIKENLPDAHGQPARGVHSNALQLFGRLTSKITSNAAIWRLYAQLTTVDQESLTQANREKALQYLQKSHRCSTLAVNWEKEINKCKEVLGEATLLAKSYMDCSSYVEDPAHVIQMLSSARLMGKGVLTKIKKHHTDVISGELTEELKEPCNQLESQIEIINQAIQSKTQ